MPFSKLFIASHITVLLIYFSMISNLSAAQPGQHDISFSEITDYAGFANAAYQTSDNIREFSKSRQYYLSRYHTLDEIQVAWFISTNDETRTQVIAIRGTSNIENAIVDIALKLVPDEKLGIKLHEGFSYSSRAVYSEIKAQLKKGYVVNTTGHSLGGAIAVILAMHLDTDHYNVGLVTTFGQPKVTNISGANKFEHLNIIRVVAPKDLVPVVPLFDPMDINNLDIYWHTGREIVLLPGNTYAVLTGVNSMLRATRFTQKPLDEENLKNHQMSRYLEMIRDKLPQAKLVSYQNDFNLFNLFGS